MLYSVSALRSLFIKLKLTLYHMLLAVDFIYLLKFISKHWLHISQSWHCFFLWFFTGQDPKCPQAEEILYTLKERQYVDQIEKAYNYASRLLLDLVMEERELIPRLRYWHFLSFFCNITLCGRVKINSYVFHICCESEELKQ